MHIKVIGQGPDLVMLHGWSMHSAVWHHLSENLAQHFTLHLVDLPGHGYSEWQQNAFELDTLIDNLAEQVPRSAYWLGWSLGGLISIAFATKCAERVQKLILLAATPCFVKTQNWDSAMESSIFKAFADNLDVNQHDTLQRFLMLQARGSAHSKDTIRQLAEQLALETPATPQALKAGLSVLINSDLRHQFAGLSCPSKVILGERDTLIPVAVSADLHNLNSKSEVTVIAKAGHAPFISHYLECQTEIEQFLHDK
ncbi:MAG: pimeloyl-ACP methyl ester esterase BioH [Gammaproteobacteria bacterium]|nr:pimeloyl-ACP methyl ester esterase BioH [Gammaproteobacteria bacterium]